MEIGEKLSNNSKDVTCLPRQMAHKTEGYLSRENKTIYVTFDKMSSYFIALDMVVV